MTVKIGEMTAIFANSVQTFTAVGMHVTDYGSADLSRLLDLSVNANSKMIVYKSGETHINTDFASNSTNTILEIKNGGTSYVTVAADRININKNTRSNAHIYVESYSEGAVNVGTSTTFNLALGSVFITNAAVFDYANFIKPNTAFSTDLFQSFSCTVIVNGSATAANTVWAATNVLWPYDKYPNPAGNVAIYNFVNIAGSNRWYGLIAGENYRR